MPIDLLISNGILVTVLGVLNGDIAIAGERIMAIGSPGSFSNPVKVIDASGKIIIPGGIDTHTHFEAPFAVNCEETWAIATSAAAIGGTTTVIDVTRSSLGESLLAGVKRQFSRAAPLAGIDYTTKAVITASSDFEKVLDEMEAVVSYGVPAFKCYTINRASGLFLNDWQIYKALERVKEIKGMLTIHAENCFIGEEWKNYLLQQGKTDPKYHAVSKPPLVEILAINGAMTLAKATGANTYIVHTSTKKGVDIISAARNNGWPVYCETCPQYLTLTKDYLEPKYPRGIYYVCSPPIRDKEDIEGLWKGIIEGEIDTIGSDHVPYTKKSKEDHCNTFGDIPNGFPGCEVRIPIIYSEGVVKRGLSLERFVELISTNAAKIFGIYPQKGVIAPGSDADLVIIDPKRRHSLAAKALHMGTDFSVYEDWETTGWPIMTILRGKIIAENDIFTGDPGDGKFIAGELRKF